MGVPIASGLPDYGPAGTINFNPELYSAKLVEVLQDHRVRRDRLDRLRRWDHRFRRTGQDPHHPGRDRFRLRGRRGPQPAVPDQQLGDAGHRPAKSFRGRAVDGGFAPVGPRPGRHLRQRRFDPAAHRGRRGHAHHDPCGRGGAEQRQHRRRRLGNINLGSSTTPRTVTKTDIVDFIVDCGTVLDEAERVRRRSLAGGAAVVHRPDQEVRSAHRVAGR